MMLCLDLAMLSTHTTVEAVKLYIKYQVVKVSPGGSLPERSGKLVGQTGQANWLGKICAGPRACATLLEQFA